MVRATLTKAPWYEGALTEELLEAVAIMGDGVWREAASEFYAEKVAKESLGKQAPKGIQRHLNRVLTQRFTDAGWIEYGGRFVHGRTWVRVTFRHQMSLGSDIVDALRAVGREKMQQVAILAASQEFLSIISPNDQKALTSFEKLKAEVNSLEGCIEIPLVIGRLEPSTTLTAEVANVIKMPRPRDTYVPGD